MPAKDPLVFIMRIPDSCRRIGEYVEAGGPNWPSNPLVKDAVCRHVTIVGEAARRLDETFRREHAEIPWSAIIGARNIVMHAYDYLKPELIRELAEKDAPELPAHCLRISGEAKP